MPKRIFKVKVIWENKDWNIESLADYIQDWVKTGEGSFDPDDRPEILAVEVDYVGKEKDANNPN